MVLSTEDYTAGSLVSGTDDEIDVIPKRDNQHSFYQLLLLLFHVYLISISFCFFNKHFVLFLNCDSVQIFVSLSLFSQKSHRDLSGMIFEEWNDFQMFFSSRSFSSE